MKLAVSAPQSPEGRAELERRAAIAYARAVLETVERLNCPKEQKLRLLKAVRQKAGGT